MPYSGENFPASMKNLTPKVREKAIEITNKLIDEGMDEGRAIAIGTSQAEKWGERRDMDIKKDDKSEKKDK